MSRTLTAFNVAYERGRISACYVASLTRKVTSAIPSCRTACGCRTFIVTFQVERSATDEKSSAFAGYRERKSVNYFPVIFGFP